ncbi:uncharacterized protein SPSK_02863 [Sporothrix schenckii 1099-18]|uniref:Phospholipase/carboxylesterase/thioesterase domain-containing protein n=1 Tax=Sporothrix schenckii 1099-18 TaxID=1397361 RepID=A0A0F2MDD1_SPOSC|nr:uncharacterized protein SPSK_02863 [Sporothrix schenckii 1099-18]KJR86141.1 hypothetical protein SPSK_02863 [Sporothrix schenckii 1099-18]
MEQSTTPDRRRRGDAPAPPPYIVESITAHTHSFILLHGLGSNGEKFGREMMAHWKELRRPSSQHNISWRTLRLPHGSMAAVVGLSAGYAHAVV